MITKNKILVVKIVTSLEISTNQIEIVILNTIGRYLNSKTESERRKTEIRNRNKTKNTKMTFGTMWVLQIRTTN